MSFHFFFFNDTATTEIYTLSLHDALPIYRDGVLRTEKELEALLSLAERADGWSPPIVKTDRKSTRLNSSHDQISYAVFCLKKKTKAHRYRPQGRQAHRRYVSSPARSRISS